MTFSNPPSFLPPLLATGQGNSNNGRQQIGSGLVTHRGIIDANSFRAQGTLYPQSGAGVELVYTQASKIGTLQSYDRDAQQYTDLNVSAKNINLVANGGGKVSLPAGTVQALIAGWGPAGSGWSTALGAWQETEIRASSTAFTGVPVRADYSLCFLNNTAGVITYIGLGWDGAIGWNIAQIHSASNYMCHVGGSLIASPPAGASHRMSVFVGVQAGTMTFVAAVHQWLQLTEQRA